MSSQADVNQSMVEALQGLHQAEQSAMRFISSLVDKQVEIADILLAMSERQELMVDLITAHVDNHET